MGFREGRFPEGWGFRKYIDYTREASKLSQPGLAAATPLCDDVANVPEEIWLDPYPRGGLCSRIAVVRDIGPHVAPYGLIGAALGFGFWIVLAFVVNFFTWLASLINLIT